MVLRHGWVVLVVAVAVVLAVAAGWWTAGRQRPAQWALPVAHLDRLRTLPAYRRAVRRRTRLMAVEMVGLVCAGLGGLTWAAGLSAPDPTLQHRRDIVLCLDVSGSMRQLDAQVLTSYLALADQLRGERIGFVMFDSTAVTVFPLTSDYRYVTRQLRLAQTELMHGNPAILAGTAENKTGRSLIGDGIESCVQRFDQRATDRPRTLVLATDNDLGGRPIYSLEQAVSDAVRRDVLIMGIVPQASQPADVAALRLQVERTGGAIELEGAGDAVNVNGIVDAVRRREAATLPSGQVMWRAEVVPGAGLIVVGMLIAAGARQRLGPARARRGR